MPNYKIVLTWESIYNVAEIAEYIEDKYIFFVYYVKNGIGEIS